mmetsp:Transcript_7030/g.10531  ORF Transcript_7030/g.10531 Transcript_7030/m.10531 type:complete len:88 (-) Transcript_7030:262-525(-)
MIGMMGNSLNNMTSHSCCHSSNITTLRSMHVEEKRGLKPHGVGWHMIQACFDGCTCHTCRVVNECKVYENDGAVGSAAPESTEMVRN